jgi:hypothetical protein
MMGWQIARLSLEPDTKSIFITLRSSVAHVSSSGDDNPLYKCEPGEGGSVKSGCARRSFVCRAAMDECICGIDIMASPSQIRGM